MLKQVVHIVTIKFDGVNPLTSYRASNFVLGTTKDQHADPLF
jgi:hypothetical protein